MPELRLSAMHITHPSNTSRRKVLVTGANGQLGRQLVRALAPFAEIVAVGHDGLDITNRDSVRAFVSKGSFTHVVNCAAYTAVDKAETDGAEAMAVNGVGAGNIAAACSENAIRLIHVSTDFVFSGDKNSPYVEDDATGPLSVYGATKLEGERRVMHECPPAIIVRTGWLYSEEGRNFLLTIARNLKAGRDLKVVDDQTGTPTYAADLADAIAVIVAADNPAPGIYHFSDDGVATWYDFACAIRDAVVPGGVVAPCTTSEYPTPACRPAYSVLDKEKIKRTFNLSIPDWRESLGRCVAKLDIHEI